MNDWLASYMAMTEESESPRQFFYWSALVAIATVVKNNFYLDRYFYKLYPNIYVLFIAKSGLRKGVPVNLAEKLVGDIDNNRIITGRSSIQAIMKELSEAFTREEGGPPMTDATCLISSDEFSTSLVKDPDALTILTKLYDGQFTEKFRNMTKHAGTELLINVNVNLLGAMNPTHFRDLVTSKEITGGFIARCIMVHADRRSRINALTRPPDVVYDRAYLGQHLRYLAGLKGEFVWPAESRDYYEEWYGRFKPEDFEDETGSLGRVHDTILKVAMLIALARRGEPVLKIADIEEARKECLPKAKFAEEFTKTGAAQLGPLKKKLIDILLNKPTHSITKVELLKNYYMEFDSGSLLAVMESLEEGKIITVIDRALDTATLTLTPSTVEKFRIIMEALQQKNVGEVKKEDVK